MHKLILIHSLVFSVLALSACSTLQNPQAPSKPIATQSTIKSTVKKPDAVEKPANPVTQALRKDAETAMNSGDTTTATRLLERALRVDARDAETYLLFARLRRTEGDEKAALQFIDKGLSVRPAADTSNRLQQLRKSIESATGS